MKPDACWGSGGLKDNAVTGLLNWEDTFSGDFVNENLSIYSKA